jgi:formylglycine-generating enzyme required for sulfatase activity
MRFKGSTGFLVAFLVVVLAAPGFANHIVVGTPTLTGLNLTDDYVLVQFDLSWDNSFRDDVNWDAAWVFVKYKQTGGDWHHAFLNTTAGNHTIPAGYTCSVGETDGNGMGVFIYRSANGSGNTNLASVQLRWEYGANGVADGATVTVKVFAIEMVYVPQGAFYVGDADNDQINCFHDGDDAGPYYISSESAITVGTGDGQLYYDQDYAAYAGDRSGPIPAAFPKGYAAFYCMKYEISQEQYADFLNTLTTTQDGTRFPNYGSFRYTIGGSSGSRSAGVEDRACNWLSWMDGAAYADWAGLRPMTELEFEKVCRGTQTVVDDEYAWGANTIVADASLTISGSEDGTETITTDVFNGACCYGNNTHSGGDGGQGPLRCGIFATNSSTRAEAGASYYGIMELSGNLWERPVTVGNTTGRGFTGTHGDGALSTNGNATNSDWPGYSGGEVTGATGTGFRGGSWFTDAFVARVSDRAMAGGGDTARTSYYGFRGVRSVP